MSGVKTFHSRLFWKIYISFSSLFLIAAIALAWVVFLRVQKTAREIEFSHVKEQLKSHIPLAMEACRDLEGHKAGFEYSLSAVDRKTKIRLIDSNGAFLFSADSTKSALPGEILGSLRHSVFDPNASKSNLDDFIHILELDISSAREKDLWGVVWFRSGDGKVCALTISKLSENFQTGFRELWNTTGFIAVFGILTALALGWSLVRKIMIPISEMVDVAEALRKGHYDRKVRLITNDDLGQLGGSLNKLGEEMRRKLGELQRLENVRRDFVANVSHEIKTPLTSIKGYVETLQSGVVEDPQMRQRFLEKIERNSTRLTTLVQDILSLAKIESLEDSFQLSPVDWTGVIHSVVSRYEDTMGQKNLKLRLDLPADQALVLGDREGMIQVLDNLLSNAIKYTPDGGQVTIQLVAKPASLILSVSDTGIGIPTEHLDRIFERFYRVDKARSREMGGTGLGLSIVKHLVSGMGGDVTVSSTLGVGSHFSVSLKRPV